MENPLLLPAERGVALVVHLGEGGPEVAVALTDVLWSKQKRVHLRVSTA